jgi:hypothetical protein
METITYEHALYVIRYFVSYCLKYENVETNDNHTQLCNSY